MSVKKVRYQEKAIEELSGHTSSLLETEDYNSPIIFKSPTGSGKTVMMAQFIKNFIRDTKYDICFIWISIGKGELQRQSKEKLESIFEGFPEVTLLDEDYFGSKKKIPQKEVVVVNWEKIRDKDSTTGEWKNTLMRDGEHLNFRDILFNTHEAQRKIILIIDESHIGRTSRRTEEIKNEINASVIIEMTATPSIPSNFIDDVSDGKAGYVKVNIKDVIDAEMVKKKLVINEGLMQREDAVMDLELLHLALEKRQQLKEKLEQEGSSVNPLIIVQLPNAEEGNYKKDIIIQALKEKDITINNRKLAVWLSDEKGKVNLESISNNIDSVEVLLFKQAIDTGWDCPRAQILLKYRETTSETFERQTLGRILRMPEQKHYANDTLNKAYVYTDYIGNVLEIIDEEFDFPDNLIEDIPLQAMAEYENIALLTQKVKRKKKNVIKENMDSCFRKTIQEKGLEKSNHEKNKKILGINSEASQLTEKIVTDFEINTEDILEKEQVSGNETEFQLDEFRTQRLFDRLLKKHSASLGNDRNYLYNILKGNIYELLNYYIEDIYQLKHLIIDAQRIFILNYEQVFHKIISDTLSNYKELKAEDIIEETLEEGYMYTIPEHDNINSQTYEKVEVEGYFYNECYLEKNRSKPERYFEAYILKTPTEIQYWLKNRDQGARYFSIPYEIEGKWSDFYPDYLILFSDTRIGLFETKDKNDNSKETKAKAETLHQYIKSQNINGIPLVGGIVANFGTEETPYLKININEEYTLNQTDWVDLDNIYLSNKEKQKESH